jgi:DNA-binding NtrC family response regulator
MSRPASLPDADEPTSLGPSPTTPQFTSMIRVPRLELYVETEAGRPVGRRAALDGDLLRVGSHPSNDLVLSDPMVSRFHCRLARGAEYWSVIDTGSLNGTRVGGVRVRDAFLPLPECRLNLGESVVRIRELDSEGEVKVTAAPTFGGLYGHSVVMRRLFEIIQRVARTDVDVLIEGESGTGKELIAAEIVRRGPRANKPLIIVDCGAISHNLIESELFGHARGAFTGADRQRTGAFDAADGGTVFLDEIGELPLDMQPKLLRALAAREVRRMGENTAHKIDVRVIAATNRRLEREVNQGRFREDLYYRLSVVQIHVPPLRERLEDIELLVNSFLASLGATDKFHLFTAAIFEDLARRDWPGNVRELRNFVERWVVFDGVFPPEDGEPNPVSPSKAPPPPGVDLETPFRAAKDATVEHFERAYLSALLAWAEGNVSRAARKASLDRMYLHRLLQKHGLRRGGSLTE